MRSIIAAAALLFAALPASTPLHAQTAEKPWPIKVVVVTTFEPGEDTGDAPGEFQNWVEREPLAGTLAFPGGVHPIRYNATHDVLGIVTGMTLVNATASVMALGVDPRFDLTHAYWLVDGIAGVDPADGTVGTAAWASYVVGDVSRSIDSREAPASWGYGLFPVGSTAPNVYPAHVSVENNYELNAGLARWAYELTRGMKLPDNAAMAANRAAWKEYALASQPPSVVLGDSYASDTYWHGAVLTQAANDWVSLWTKGKGNFVMTNMEDSGVAEALRRLDRMKRADYSRLMVLRVGSNFSRQATGKTALESVTTPYLRSTAFEVSWVVGSRVVHELQGNWARYEGQAPAAR
ncbi:purine nucleoside permease [Granulicella sp. WH15]|nr:purine nucleoside permease [Granulicella sp. WH15]